MAEKKTKVALVRCEEYEEGKVRGSILKSLKHLGGLEKFVKPGSKVLLKPNLISAVVPEKAATTHPLILKVLIDEIRRLKSTPVIGESCGGSANIKVVFEATGMKRLSEETGVELVNFAIKKKEKAKGREDIFVSKYPSEFDLVINLPKMKTHLMTLFTGAVKNMYGCVPGEHKTQIHFRNVSPQNFASTLVDIYAHFMPGLTIMDGIIGMEGNGPTGGSARKVGVIIAGEDGIAVDAVATHMIGYKPGEILTTVDAIKKKVGEGNLRNIEIVGGRIEDFRVDFDKPITTSSMRLLLRGYHRMRNSVKPIVLKGRCVKCGVCMKNCPVKAIELDPYPEFDYDKCIRCFCCHELCPEHAIGTKQSIGLKIVKSLLSFSRKRAKKKKK